MLIYPLLRRAIRSSLFVFTAAVLFFDSSTVVAQQYKFEWEVKRGYVEPDLFQPVSVAVNAGGSIYVTDKFNDKIYKLKNNGDLIMSWGAYGSGNGQFNSPRGIAIDKLSNVYVADTENARIQKFDSNGVFITSWTSFGDPWNRFAPACIAFDQAGNVYVTETSTFSIRKFTNTGTFISYIGTGLVAQPSSIALDAADNVYVSDGNEIKKIGVNGVLLQTFGSTGNGDGEFMYPSGIQFDKQGNIFIGDYDNNRIQKFNSNGVFISAFGQHSYLRYTLIQPTSLAIDEAGDLYTIDYSRLTIKRYFNSGQYKATYGPNFVGSGYFASLSGIAADASGNIYVSDWGNHVIHKFNSKGVALTKWGNEGHTDSLFNHPAGIAIDNAGVVYVVNSYEHGMVRFTSDGKYLSRLGPFYSYGTVSNIALDNSNHIYLTTQGLYSIVARSVLKLDLTGTLIETIDVDDWSPNYTSYNEDVRGIAITGGNNLLAVENKITKFNVTGTQVAQFGTVGPGMNELTEPAGIAVDALGNIYVSDKVNNVILKYNSAGTFLMSWGGTGTEQGKFNWPGGIAVDGSGNVYVLDIGNQRVQKFSYDPNPPVATAIKTAQDVADVMLFPNPSAGTVKIQTAEAIKSVTVINSLGQKEVFTGTEITTSFKGLLIVVVETEAGSVTKKIVVQ